MSEDLLEIRYDCERIVHPHSNVPGVLEAVLHLHSFSRYHLIIEDGVEHVPNISVHLLEVELILLDIKKMTMANSVKTLGDRAFESFANLEEVIWSENLETIGEYSLMGCESLGKFFGSTNFPEQVSVYPSEFDASKVWDTSP